LHRELDLATRAEVVLTPIGPAGLLGRRDAFG
jgi:hypothetical protein